MNCHKSKVPLSTQLAGRYTDLYMCIFSFLFVIGHLPGYATAGVVDYCPLILRGQCMQQCDSTHTAVDATFLCSGQNRCCVSRYRVIDRQSPAQTTTQASSTSTTNQAQGNSQTTSSFGDRGLAQTSQCGVQGHSRAKRVVGGTDAGHCLFPWMVYISRDPAKVDICSGTLISARHIVTAAHCFDMLNGQKPTLTIGEYNRHETNSLFKFETLDYTVQNHPNYSRFSYNNDIAVLTLSQEIHFNNYDCIRPICLPRANQSFSVGTQCTVAGWGSTSRGTVAKPSTVLLKASVKIQQDSLCRTKFGFLFDPVTQICAGDMVTAADSCEGDSGGPLMCTDVASDGDSSAQYLGGVISSGANPCGQAGIPAIYTDVAAKRDWIDQIMGVAS